MALTEEIKNDKIEVLHLAEGYPVVNVRTATIIKRDGVEVNRSFHRYVLTPDSNLENESQDVLAIANAVFTNEVKAAYTNFVENRGM
jgi:hypothetical protein